MAVNFDFLKGSNPELYELGHNMEENFFKDTEASAHYGSDLLNDLVKEIYEENGLKYTSKGFMTKDIDNLFNKKLIDEKTLKGLEKAKLIRDRIIDKDDYSFSAVLSLHSALIGVASGFFDKYEN